MFQPRIALDIGTSHIRGINLASDGVETIPAVVLKDRLGKILAAGETADSIQHGSESSEEILFPIRLGRVQHKQSALELLRLLFQKLRARGLIQRPTVMASVPVGAMPAYRKLFISFIREAGGGQVYLIESVFAAALGSEHTFESGRTQLVLDLGAGKVDIGVLNSSNVVLSHRQFYGGEALLRGTDHYIRRQYRFLLGREGQKRLVEDLISAVPLKQDRSLEFPGQDLKHGQPGKIVLSANELLEVVEPILNSWVASIRSLIRQLSPEQAADVLKHGMLLTGGLAQLHQLKDFFEKKLELPCSLAEKADECVIQGAGKALGFVGSYRERAVG